jgi:alanine racemase
MFNETRRAAWVEINLSNLNSNFAVVKKIADGSKVISCIKADAYGHGAVKIAWELIKAGTDYLGVGTLEEAVALRVAGIRTKIVLLGVTPRGNVKDIVDLDIVPVITTLEDAILLSETAEWAAAGKKLDVLIALETGMGRIGFQLNAEDLNGIATANSLENINVLGFFSHFATSDSDDPTFALAQIDAFEKFLAEISLLGIDTSVRTMANSAAIACFPQAHYDLVRPGLALYGMYPSAVIDKEIMPISPVMTVKANIVYLKKVPAGFPVGYGSTFVTKRESLLATLPLGYADGLPRHYSNRASVLVGGTRAPIVGNICMDQCMVDVTDVPNVAEYDEVVVMGIQGESEITADEIAENSGTVNYEVTCRFGQRLPKIYRLD